MTTTWMARTLLSTDVRQICADKLMKRSLLYDTNATRSWFDKRFVHYHYRHRRHHHHHHHYWEIYFVPFSWRLQLLLSIANIHWQTKRKGKLASVYSHCSWNWSRCGSGRWACLSTGESYLVRLTSVLPDHFWYVGREQYTEKRCLRLDAVAVALSPTFVSSDLRYGKADSDSDARLHFASTTALLRQLVNAIVVMCDITRWVAWLAAAVCSELHGWYWGEPWLMQCLCRRCRRTWTEATVGNCASKWTAFTFRRDISLEFQRPLEISQVTLSSAAACIHVVLRHMVGIGHGLNWCFTL